MRIFNQIKTASVTTILAVGLTCAPSAAETSDLTIRDLAPEGSFVVVGVEDMRRSCEKFNATPMGKFLESPGFKNALAELTREEFGTDDVFGEMHDQLGLEHGTLTMPHGVGMAVYMLPGEDDFDDPTPGIFAFADWGDDADKTHEFMEAMFEEGRGPLGRFDYELFELRGRQVRVYEMEDTFSDIADSAPGFDPSMPVPDFDQFTDAMDKVFYLREGNHFMISTTEMAMLHALEVVDGDASSPLASHDAFNGAMSQLGANDVYGVLMTTELSEMVMPMIDMLSTGMGSTLLQGLLGDIDAWGWAMAIDGEVGFVDQAISIHINGEKKGLMKLIDSSSEPGDVPGFIGPDTYACSSMNFRFDELMDVVEDVVTSLPPMYAGQVEPMLMQFGPGLRQAFGTLGPEMYIFNSAEQPMTPESMMSTIAIKCSDPEAVTPLVALFGPSMGLSPRDFLGQTIYGGQFAPFAIGIGGGYLVIGTDEAVENAMRSGNDRKKASVADEKFFSTGRRALPGGAVVGWGVIDMISQMKYSLEMAEMMADAPMNDEFGDDFARAQMDKVDEVLNKMFEPEQMKRYFGPVIWDLRSRDDGYVFKFYALPPGG